MKRFLGSILIALVLSFGLFAQTNTNTTTTRPIYNANGELTGYEIVCTFTADSTGSQLTPLFTFDECQGVDFNTHPITFSLKAVGTYGTPNRAVYLEGCFASASDTVALDSLADHATGQTEADTLGKLTLNNLRAPLGYRLFIRDITADINSGTITLYVPFVGTAYRKSGF